ncbi:Uncharacterized conserved protein YkwD, contains CAP (CSP/antigen 5/PR1) domain [Mesobacillus persicus]|uniref:Uncharacterized conserved protein YkwD, contains CAP (CSP/antigen 5/PR1) domain n=1 Tax=Mesobacillus persicus TaxID=930146 RepID=A0A1H7ZMI9_9BACI|nr:CAP domain-containing protein [Mesobacillus persicus]SEM59545.1 Uncharacterized conserved protein YkwD, contains CAP (CSP/antigen 5/PR1) domain [Mesobacillus persicus]
MRFFFVILIGFLLYNSWPVIEERFGDNPISSIITEIGAIKENTDLSTVTEDLNVLKDFINEGLIGDSVPKENQIEIERPELTQPSKEMFSISNIELGATRSEVEKQLGAPNRSSINEYGTQWHAYHQNFQNFLMIAYDEENHVAGLYTNHDLVSSTNEIRLGSPREVVHQKLGSSLERIQKGMVFYQLPKERDYDLFLIDGSYVSIFYDKHQNNTVTAIQIIEESLEQQRSDFYTKANDELKEGFEYQMFDLTNAARVKHGLPVLEWDDVIKETARKHSIDMAENNFFSHTNLNGQSPFDRMEADNILFSTAGENLAYGQTSSVYAHEGSMNSLGHRENILKEEFKMLGVGVAFNTQSQPYYTQNYYTKRGY